MGWPARVRDLFTARSARRRLNSILPERDANPLPFVKRHEETPLAPRLMAPLVPPPVARTGTPPLSADCEKIEVTSIWSIHCFLRSYAIARRVQGEDADAVVDSILRMEAPHAVAESAPATPAAIELARRVQLAVAVLMRAEGIDVAMPVQPQHPTSRNSTFRQPWLRALLTGWP